MFDWGEMSLENCLLGKSVGEMSIGGTVQIPTQGIQLPLCFHPLTQSFESIRIFARSTFHAWCHSFCFRFYIEKVTTHIVIMSCCSYEVRTASDKMFDDKRFFIISLFTLVKNNVSMLHVLCTADIFSFFRMLLISNTQNIQFVF